MMTGLPDPRPVDRHATDRRRYLFGLFTSSIGGGMVSLVGSYLIYQKTHHASAVALIIVFSNVPALFLPTVATKLAHRWGGPKDYVAIWGAYYFLSLIPFVLDLTGHLSATNLLAWFLLEGIVQGLVTPAAGLVRTILAPPEIAAEFNGSVTRTISLATVIGILAAGGALALVGPGWIFLFVGLSGAPLVLAVVPLISATSTATAGPPPRFSQARAVQRENPEIRAAFRFALVIFLLSGYAVTLPSIADGIGHRAIILSSLQAAAVVGGLFVVVGVRFIHRRTTWINVQRACVAIIAAAVLYLGWVALRDHPPHWYLITAMVAIIPLGFALNLDSSILNAAVQVATPSESRASVLTAFALVPMIALPLSEVVISGMSDLVSVSFSLMVLGGVTLLLVILPRHASVRTAFSALDDEHLFPEEALDGAITIGRIEDAGQAIADQVVGPEIPFLDERER